MRKKIRDIYDHLGDEESREIFGNRLLFSLTGNRSYIKKIVCNIELYQRVCEILLRDKRRKYIVGAGQWGKIIADLFLDFGFEGFLDSYSTGTYRKLPIFPIQEFLQNNPDISVYISSTTFHDELCQMMKKNGMDPERIVDVAGMMFQVYHEQQYFDLPCLVDYRSAHEVFVDGGCYDGANSIRFIQWAGSAQKTLYAFEADKENVGKCKRTLERIEGACCHLIDKGLWSSETVLNFCSKANEASAFSEIGQLHIPVTSLDAMIEEKVTFIKMDIEGAEYEALKGAENIISRDCPKLAISVYHKPEDIWELPRLILSFYPEYTFFLRHYSLSSEETVLYAIPGSGKK